MSRLDARTKLIMVVVVTTLAILAIDIVYLAIITVLALFIDILLKPDMKKIIKRLWRLVSVIIFICIIQSLTIKGGKALIHIGNVNLVSINGLISAGEFLLRMVIIILAGTIMSTSSEQEILDGLLKIKIPYEIVYMTSISFRFLPIFREEFKSRLNAIAIRGISIKKLSFNKKFKLYSYLISPTIAGSMLKSKQLAKSMQSKGFRALRKRTMLANPKLTLTDYFVIIIMLGFMVVYLYLMYTLGELL